MKYKFEKSMRIITDLMAYCHKLGACEYHMDMSLEKGVSVYQIRTTLHSISPQVLEELKEMLGTPRQHEVEQDYWGLSGDMGTELELVGMMVDEATVTYEDGELSIAVCRNE